MFFENQKRMRHRHVLTTKKKAIYVHGASHIYVYFTEFCFFCLVHIVNSHIICVALWCKSYTSFCSHHSTTHVHRFCYDIIQSTACK